MKFLIFEVFSGVGLCNQLFSLETAIYVANISNRKLILLIKNSLCHCGKASWDYGYLLNFFTNDFLNYLPFGFEVYYKTVPNNIKEIINNDKLTKKFNYSNRFSHLVFVDKNLDTEENKNDIDNFCHKRTKEYLQFHENDNYDYFYIHQSNASRCFFNFYTSKSNYILMNDICKSLKFKDVFYNIADNIYNEINSDKNSYNIFMHLRFGDYFKDNSFLSRFNKLMIKNIIPYLEGHNTNLIKPKIYILCDNLNNTDFFKHFSKYKLININTISNKHFDDFFKKNNMLFYDIHKCNNNSLNYAVIDMILSSKSDEFIGTLSSTFSNYIQYLRYINNKTYCNYSNIQNGNFCKFIQNNDSKYDWVKYNYNRGHPVSWHAFWDIKQKHSNVLMTIQGKTDGFGSQLQAIFSLIAYCYYKGYTFIHTPMYKMHHNNNNIKNFPKHMNDFINIESKFKTINELSNYEKSILHTFKEGPFVHGSLHPEYFYDNHILNLLREIYFSREKPKTCYDVNYNNIALHIRRGDVNENKHYSRFSKNEEYIDLLKKIDLENSIIHIFSEGDERDFQDIVDAFPNIKSVMHINEDIQVTFHHLVMSDVLVLAKSSFGYCAALLNKNKIIANLIKRWWHKPLKQWNLI